MQTQEIEKKCTFRIPASLHSRLKLSSAIYHRSMSALVETALDDLLTALDAHDKKKKGSGEKIK